MSKDSNTARDHTGVHCPKRSVNFVTYDNGRWAPSTNNENLCQRKQTPSAIVMSNEILGSFWDSFCIPTRNMAASVLESLVL
jgi:hypothetical protein